MTATLADLTTLRVGGPAAEFGEASTRAELVARVRQSDSAGVPLLLIGGGSNLLVADAGFPGLVLRIATRGIREAPDPAGPGVALVTAQAGEPWDSFVAATLSAGLAGLEALSGIPGAVGATPIQNVGAYGAEVAQFVTEIEVLDRTTGGELVLPAEQAGFGYRSSLFKSHPDRWVVLAVTFALTRGTDSAPVRYSELARTLGVEVGASAPAGRVREAVLGLRRAKGMVLDGADPDTYSAGSFFTNPILPAAVAKELPVGAPRFPAGPGLVKTSAAWLISNAGFQRGFRVRPNAPAGLSTKHSLAVTNRGAATAADLLELAGVVRAGVAERFGILLEPEPVLVGCSL
ncbi:MAG: UDP-N-acetylmuramate dehydrogenase [Candidatus Nanopelagicales bacterium]